ncbi:MAG: hypothetical protein ACI4QA_01660 [Candidatus Spyradosoma sp.]
MRPRADGEILASAACPPLCRQAARARAGKKTSSRGGNASAKNRE